MRFASENGFPASVKLYGSYAAVLEDPDVEAVYVPLPTILHVRWAVLAAEKKKHVLLEKPVALIWMALELLVILAGTAFVQFYGQPTMNYPKL